MYFIRKYGFVFSAQAEVFPLSSATTSTRRRFLRASGGVSPTSSTPASRRWFSPRKRRCFLLSCPCLRRRAVFSAQAEVFPQKKSLQCRQNRFLRASGGVSSSIPADSGRGRFSPRKRRCFFLIKVHYANHSVFSAQAEVFLARQGVGVPVDGFLRASGGVSPFAACGAGRTSFSPRKRRCFLDVGDGNACEYVFSAQAEVFLPRPSCLRGCLRFSPRKRRCFLWLRQELQVPQVFSAQAEVFLAKIDRAAERESFLRASGGVSLVYTAAGLLHEFSPRKRRCFPEQGAEEGAEEVFSAQAEVFLRAVRSSAL